MDDMLGSQNGCWLDQQGRMRCPANVVEAERLMARKNRYEGVVKRYGTAKALLAVVQQRKDTGGKVKVPAQKVKVKK